MSLLIYPFEINNGPNNMATDMWLFQNLYSSNPIFRHYGWIENETTFGYGQKWEWIKRQNIPDFNLLTRRPTGGGIVKHGQDWTYTLMIPSGHPTFKKPALDHYEEIHSAIGKAFEEQGLATSLLPCPNISKKGIPGDCFLEPVGKDLMNESGTQKIAGAAMKRGKKGILIQGTIDPLNPEIKSMPFFESFVKEMEKLFLEKADRLDWPIKLSSGKQSLVEMFSSASWRENRKELKKQK